MKQVHGWYFPAAETHFPEMLENSIKKGGPAEYQQPVRLLSFKHAKSNRVAIDVGANVGLWSRDLVKHFEQVIAFEPIAFLRECLKKNVIASNLTIESVALGHKEGKVNMIIEEWSTGHTHVDPNSTDGDTKIITLDSLDLQIVDYIKIDCEGFEYRVLQGGEQTIKRCKPVIVVEQKPHDAYSKEYGRYAAVDLLKSWGLVRLGQVNDDWIMGWK